MNLHFGIDQLILMFILRTRRPDTINPKTLDIVYVNIIDPATNKHSIQQYD